MVKSILTTRYCIDKNCGWEETNHKIRDGMKCPKCNNPVMTKYPNKKDK